MGVVYTPKILWRKLLQVAFKPWNSLKFSPSKISRYIMVFNAMSTLGSEVGGGIVQVLWSTRANHRGRLPWVITFTWFDEGGTLKIILFCVSFVCSAPPVLSETVRKCPLCQQCNLVIKRKRDGGWVSIRYICMLVWRVLEASSISRSIFQVFRATLKSWDVGLGTRLAWGVLVCSRESLISNYVGC